MRVPGWAGSGWGRGAAALAAAAALAFYAAQCVRRGSDFVTMWGAWRFVLEGKYLYSVVRMEGATPAHWRNPPSFTFATSPLGLLDVKAAAYAWFFLKLGLLAWVIRGLKRFSDRHAPGRPWTVWGPVLLAACWFNNDLTIGHMNLAASALILAGLLAWLEGRPRAAALWSSLAVVSKGPAALLPLFFAARRQFMLALATVSLAAAWTALPALVWGPRRTIEYNRDFKRHVGFDAIFGDVDNGWAENWGLPELVMRAAGQAHPENRYGRALELVRLPYPTAKALAIALTGGCLALLAGWWWARPGAGLKAGFLAPALHHAGLAATATLVLSPVTRKAYLGTLLLPYFVLWGYLQAAPKGRLRTASAALGAASLVLSSLTHTDLLGRSAAFFFETWHALSFSLLALLAAQAAAALDAEGRA